jgi:deazaflavin-dependent oxidoreductase (nitroreductase family)
MAKHNASLADRLSHASEITITVTGRKSGKTISLPIWFVWNGETLYLLPVKGSDTQWYKNVLHNPAMQIEVGGVNEDFKAVPITDAKQTTAVVDRFRKKYGPGDVKKYYSKLDVAVIAQSESAG